MDKIIIISALQETLKEDKKARAIIHYLCAMLPTMLHIFHNIGYDKEAIKVALSKEKYDSLLDNFISTLKELKVPGTKPLKTLLKFSPKNIQHNESLYTELLNVLNKNKDKIRRLAPSSYRDVNKIIALYKASELSDNNWKTILDISRHLDSAGIKKYIRTIEQNVGSQVSQENLVTAQSDHKKFLKQVFKTDKPTAEEIAKLKEKDPEKYKEYRKSLNTMKKAAKAALEDAWEDEEGFAQVEDVRQVKKLLKKLGIENPIDPGFEGKVALGTGVTMFRYFTKYGKELENVPGAGVKMNPLYNEDDDTYYCTGYPQQNVTNNVYWFYTKDYRRRSLEAKHAKAKKLAHDLNIEDLRKIYYADLKPILTRKHELTPKAMAALVTAVIDDTAGRIGNPGSEKNGVYGIHNLLGEHLFTKEDKVKLSYNGKKNVHQEHIITNPVLVKALKYLKSIRKKNEYLFSVTGEHPISSNYVNKYLTGIGFPDTAHGFRKYHANRIFKKVISEKKVKEIKEKPLEVFNFAVDKVAKKLGHEPTNSIKSYIDSDLIRDYWDKAGTPPPKIVKRVLDLMNSGGDEDDD